jgi:hypothetical protein
MDASLLTHNVGVSFIVAVEDIREVKEIFYRIEPETEYRSTGFMPSTNPITGLPYPNLRIPGSLTPSIVKIDVKYTDSNDTERGPYNFAFDLDRIVLDATKKDLLDSNGMFWIHRSEEDEFSHLWLNHYTFNEPARAGIEKILYGLNKETPDTEWPPDSTRVTAGERVQYISAQVLFKDGTSTDVRVLENF